METLAFPIKRKVVKIEHLAPNLLSTLECPRWSGEGYLQVLKTITIRRGIIFAYVMCCAFLVAHIVNAVIAEALSVPVGLIGPSSASDERLT